MGTRAIIAKAILEDGEYKGKYTGVYHHWDGYPTGVGAKLIELLNTRFKGNLGSMLYWLIDQHSAGWSSLHGNRDNGYKPECYCHPKRKDRKPEAKGQFVDQDSDCCQEWTYVFDTENRLLYVTDVYAKHTMALSLEVGTPINWQHVECGENFERCNHVAEYHVKDIDERSARLSMSKYMGRTPLQIRDAIAVIINGKRYKLTGSGYNAGYRLRHVQFGCPENAWISSVVARNGRRMELPTMLVIDGEYAPYPGVVYVMPPTQKDAHESTLSQITVEVPSHSNPNKRYTVTLTATKSRTCTCPDFKYRKTECKHITATRQMF